MKIFTKDTLIAELRRIRDMGWIETSRKGNDGGVGNTLEDLLGIEENNLPLPNAGEWEIKGQRANTTSLITLFHMEPSPRACKFVSQILLPNYGWAHQKAGTQYPRNERSFRQTITAGQRTNRGFMIVVNRDRNRIEVSFDGHAVDTSNHREWLDDIVQKVGLKELDPIPYWGFDDLFCKAGTKLMKAFYAIAEHTRDRQKNVELFRYSRFFMLEGFSREKFIDAIASRSVLIDFDARTGHNHGTKFRLRQGAYTSLYNSVQEIS